MELALEGMFQVTTAIILACIPAGSFDTPEREPEEPDEEGGLGPPERAAWI